MPYDPQTGEYIPDMGPSSSNVPKSNSFGFDPGQSTRDYLAGVANPETLSALLGAEAAARPQLGAQGLRDLSQFQSGAPQFNVQAFLAARPDILNNFNNAKDDYSRMYGGLEQYAKAAADAEGLTPKFTTTQGGSLDLLKQAAGVTSGIETAANTALRTAGAADVAALAPQLAATYNQLNPEIQASLQRAEGLSRVPDAYAPMRTAAFNAQQFGDLQFNPAQASLLGSAPQVDLGGYNAAQVGAQSYNPTQASAQGYNAALAQSQGYNAQQASAQGYNAALAQSQGYNAALAQSQGYNAALAQSQGYNAQQAQSQGYDAALAQSQGYDAAQAQSRGYDAALAQSQGYDAALAQSRGYDAAQAQSQGYQSQGYTPQGYQAAQAGAGMQTEAERLARGKLGESLYAQALQAGPSAAAQLLGSRAAEFAASTGQLSPEELRNIQQGTREAYAARGIEMSNPAIAAEAAARSGAMRQRQAEDLAQAAALNQAYIQDLSANRQFGSGLYGQEIGLQQANQQAALQAALANQQTGQNLSLANLQATNQAGQFTAGLGAEAAQFGANAANQSGQFAATAANQAALQNAQLASQAGQFGASAFNQAAIQNAQNISQANQFRAASANQAAIQNAQNLSQANQFGAGAFNQAAIENAQLASQAGQFRASASNQAAIQNAQNISQANQFGASAFNQAQLQNALLGSQAGQFGASSFNQAALQNAQNISQANQFGASSANQAALQNAQNISLANQFGASAANQTAIQNAQNISQANQFGAGALNQAALQNALLGSQAGQFGASAFNQAQLQNAQNITGANQFGAGAQNQVSLANQAAFNQAGQFGAGAQNQANLANQAALNQAGMFRAEAGNQSQLTNAQLQAQYAMANQGAANQFSLANQAAGMDVNAQNRLFAANQQQQNISNLGLIGQADSATAEANRAYALNLAQGYRNAAYDPTAMLLGQQSNAGQTAAQQQGYALDLAKTFNTPTTYNPDTGINLALANQANITNRDIAQQSAAAQLAAAKAGASATKTAGVAGGAGNIIGGVLAGKIFLACIPEGELIDTPEGQVAIEDIRSGDSVIGFSGEPVKVLIKHEYAENPEAERFHRFYLDNGKDFSVCDMHRIEGERSMDYNVGNSFKGGEVVEAIAVYGGVTRSYDLLTEDIGYRMSGVAVNSMIEELAAFSST